MVQAVERMHLSVEGLVWYGWDGDKFFVDGWLVVRAVVWAGEKCLVQL